MTNAIHWTERSVEDFLYSIASDFVEQLQSKMKALDNMTRAKLAKVAGVSKGRISQIFNDPGNISLDTAIRLARALGLGVSLLTYDRADDPNNERGPINADVFRICWERAGRPFDAWDLQKPSQTTVTFDLSHAFTPDLCGITNYRGRHANKPQTLTRTFGFEVPTRAVGGDLKLKEISTNGPTIYA